jgi:hypothetical protein
VGDWIAFGDAQSGRLDLANDHTKNAIGIVQACERRDAETVRALSRPWYAFWR